MKYKELIKLIKDVSLALPDVNSFYTGDVYEINADQSVKYASVVLTNQEHNFDNNNDKFNYNFVLFFIDRLLDDESNRIDVQTAGISALKNIVTALEDYGIIIDSFRFTLFKERFNDVCSGAYATFTIQIDDIDCNEYLGIITPDKLKAISITSNGTYEGLYSKVIVDVPAPYYRSRHLEATENHKLYVASDEGLDGYESVNVNVPTPSIEENRIIIEPANGTYKIKPTSGHDAMKEVSLTVAVPNPALTALHITENGTYEAVDSGYYGFASVSVDVPQPTYNSGELVAKENGVYRASDNGYDGYYAVLVDVPEPPLMSLNVAENGHYDANTYGVRGFESVTVDVPQTSGKWVLPDGIKFINSEAIDTSLFDVTNMTDMSSMLRGLGSGVTSLDFTEWNTSNVINMSYMLNNNKNIKSYDLTSFDTSNVTDMSSMFSNSEILRYVANNFNTSAVTTMETMFLDCAALNDITSLQNWDISNVTNMRYMFGRCISLASADLSHWNVSNVTDCFCMFDTCTSLKSINISNWNFNSNCKMTAMFDGCKELTDIITNENTVLPARNNNPNLPSSLTRASLVNLLNALPTVTNSYTFTIGGENLQKLSDDEKSVAINKGWSLN